MRDAGLTYRELLDYTAVETARWEAWLRAHPDALEMPYADGRLATVRGLVHHIFAVERRHSERLLGRPVTEYDAVPAEPDVALFAAWREARALLEEFVAGADDEALERVLEFDTLAAGRVRASARKLAAHAILHGIRHWAQLAAHLREHGVAGPGLHDALFSPAFD
jgi:uncharacterized damage-inducible protein DinB